jgi:SAM-dependent methyltransferase/uncharacterized protein YbaR (Trm112 family)
MRISLLKWLRDPLTGDLLDAHAFVERPDPATAETDIVEGLLVSKPSGNVYAIMGGVPVMLSSGLPTDFCVRHRGQIDELCQRLSLRYQEGSSAGFSFSQEWETHWQQKAVRTWGWTLAERIEQFYLETESTPDELKRSLVFDAGCGSGQLTHAIAEEGPTVIGLDLSTGVFVAERHRTSGQVHYVHGDLLCPPFSPECFDIIYSQGVLHHTPDTFAAFNKVSQLARPGGKFFLWLYHWPRTFVQGLFKRPIIEGARSVICRMPLWVQSCCVQIYARTLHTRNVLFRRSDAPAFPELLVEVYDTLTPRFRHHHTPYQVAEWFYQMGFSAARLTHWDNPLGFGMMAKRERLPATPGMFYAQTKLAAAKAA